MSGEPTQAEVDGREVEVEAGTLEYLEGGSTFVVGATLTARTRDGEACEARIESVWREEPESRGDALVQELEREVVDKARALRDAYALRRATNEMSRARSELFESVQELEDNTEPN